MQVEPNSTRDILLLSKQGQAVRTHINQIRLCGRASYGVKVMGMSKDNDKVVNVSIVDELSEDDAAANAARDESEIRAAAEAAEFDAMKAKAEETETPSAEEEATAADTPETLPSTADGEGEATPEDNQH